VADQFDLNGSYQTTPLDGDLSLAPNVVAPIQVSLVLDAQAVLQMVLSSDSPQPIPFGSVANANVVLLGVTNGGGKVKAIITSADGTSQVVPFDLLFSAINQSTPITAISLQRTPATNTVVNVFLGEMA
jgi:hypothetical protein